MGVCTQPGSHHCLQTDTTHPAREPGRRRVQGAEHSSRPAGTLTEQLYCRNSSFRSITNWAFLLFVTRLPSSRERPRACEAWRGKREKQDSEFPRICADHWSLGRHSQPRVGADPPSSQ